MTEGCALSGTPMASWLGFKRKMKKKKSFSLVIGW